MNWKPNESFESLLIEFLRSLLEDFYPETEIVSRAQKWLIEQLNLKVAPFTIRHAKDIRDLVGREGGLNQDIIVSVNNSAFMLL